MIVAVDTIGSEEYQRFLSNSFALIASQHPGHTFVFISDNHFQHPLNKNIAVENIKNQSSFLYAIGIHNKVASVLKKYNASVLVTAKPFNTKVPICFIVDEKISLKYRNLSKVVVAASEFQKIEIQEKFKIKENKIDVVYIPANEIYKPVNVTEREKIKDDSAAGNEFFVTHIPRGFSDSSVSLLMLLKAFSRFKKMQKSSMHLLIVSPGIISDGFKKALQLYKFYSEVSLLENQSEAALSTVFASAYAAVYPFNSNDYSNLLQAMQSGVPVILSNVPLLSEICGNAAVYFDNTEISIADKMMLVYKDEGYRQQLIENGRTQIKKFSSEQSAEALWSSLQKATL